MGACLRRLSISRRGVGRRASGRKGGGVMPIIRHTVTPEEAGRTVKTIALKEMRLSRGMFSSLKFRNGVLLDGEPVRADVRLEAGQTLTAAWEDDETFPMEPAPDVPFSIAYADGHFLILDKPAPLPTLSSAHQSGPTLENALYARLDCPKNFVFRPLNRLDKGTSGLLCAARDAHAQQRLQKRLHSPDFVREYLAVCEGKPPEAHGVIDLPLGKAADGILREVREDGLRAVTHYRVEMYGNGRSLLRLRLETGRTHQIRAHLRALACPIVGDYLYGAPDPALPGRFALHSCLIQFQQPFTGEIIRRESPLPEELAALIR